MLCYKDINQYIAAQTQNGASYDICGRDFAPDFFLKTYAGLKKNMSDPEEEKDKLLKECISNFIKYYQAYDKHEQLNEINGNIGRDRSNIFREFNALLNEQPISMDDMKAEDMYLLLRQTYIKYTDEKIYNDTKRDVDDKYFQDIYQLENYSRDRLTITGKGLEGCIDELKNCHSAFRGSSDEFNEIERELNQLKEYIGLDKTLGKEGEKGIRGIYVSKMLRVLEEKANQYVEARLQSELQHSATGYKGKRIAAMRKVAQTLKAHAEVLEERLPEMYKQEYEAEFADRNPAVDAKVKDMLKAKAEKMTFSKRLYSEINANNGKGDLHTIVISAMDKALRKKVVSTDRCDQIYDGCLENISEYPNSVKELTNEVLYHLNSSINKDFKKYFGKRSYDDIPKKNLPMYFTDDTEKNDTILAARLEVVKAENNFRQIDGNNINISDDEMKAVLKAIKDAPFITDKERTTEEKIKAYDNCPLPSYFYGDMEEELEYAKAFLTAPDGDKPLFSQDLLYSMRKYVKENKCPSAYTVLSDFMNKYKDQILYKFKGKSNEELEKTNIKQIAKFFKQCFTAFQEKVSGLTGAEYDKAIKQQKLNDNPPVPGM